MNKKHKSPGINHLQKTGFDSDGPLSQGGTQPSEFLFNPPKKLKVKRNYQKNFSPRRLRKVAKDNIGVTPLASAKSQLKQKQQS